MTEGHNTCMSVDFMYENQVFVCCFLNKTAEKDNQLSNRRAAADWNNIKVDNI